MKTMETKTMEIEVVDIRKIVGEGKLRAFANVKLWGCVLVKGFCVMEGKNGIFVAMPSKLSKDGRWIDIVEPDEPVKREIQSKVLESYDRETDGVRN